MATLQPQPPDYTIPVYDALLAVARAVDHAHTARTNCPVTLCETCAALVTLDAQFPVWRRVPVLGTKPKVPKVASER
jgi:hypothetical protein